MHTFTDLKNRTWTLSLTIATAKRVKSLLADRGVDLLQMETTDSVSGIPLFTRLAVDIELLCDVIFACIQPQAVEAGVSDVQFGESLGGDVIFKARDAFFKEIIDFFRSLGRKEIVKAIQAQETLISNVVRRAEEKLENLDLDNIAKQAVPSLSSPLTSGKSYTDVQESVG